MVDENVHDDQRSTPTSWWVRVLSVGVVLVTAGRTLLHRSPVSDRPSSSERLAGQDDGHVPGGLLHSTVKYEHSDASFGWILGILIIAFIFAGVMHYSIWRFFIDFRDYQAKIKQPTYPLAPAGFGSLPPEPRLEQVNRMASIVKGDVYLRQQQKERLLNEYGPSADKGYVHIPIDQAIDYLANKLPVRAKQPSTQQARRQNGLVGAGESNSGRMFRGSKHE